MPDERLGGVVRTVERSLGCRQFPHILFGGDERSKLVGDQCVPREKLLAIDRLAAIEPFEVLANCSCNLRITRLELSALVDHGM